MFRKIMLTFVLQYQDFESAWYCATSFLEYVFFSGYYSGCYNIFLRTPWSPSMVQHPPQPQLTNLPSSSSNGPTCWIERKKSKMSLLNQICKAPKKANNKKDQMTKRRGVVSQLISCSK